MGVCASKRIGMESVYDEASDGFGSIRLKCKLVDGRMTALQFYFIYEKKRVSVLGMAEGSGSM